MRLLVLSPEYSGRQRQDSVKDFIVECEKISKDVHCYDYLAENDPAIECWDKFSGLEPEERRVMVAMNLLTALKWFRNQSLREKMHQHQERVKETDLSVSAAGA